MNGKEKPQAIPAGSVKLSIVLDSQGNVTVSGPIQDRLLCYGMMESAKDIIRSWKPSVIAGANGQPLPSAEPVNDGDAREATAG
jgi:hypothetical protein